MNVDELYQTIILDHYREKHHSGLREPYDEQVHHVNPSCGDELTLRVHVVDGVVEDVSYAAEGCSISQASTSIMSDLVIAASRSRTRTVSRTPSPSQASRSSPRA